MHEMQRRRGVLICKFFFVCPFVRLKFSFHFRIDFFSCLFAIQTKEEAIILNDIFFSYQITNKVIIFYFFVYIKKKSIFQLQKLNSLLNDMIDAYEKKHGPVEDRSVFDGEIIVPPHLRNLSLTSLRAYRLHGSLFGSLSRSRTFLNIPQNARHTYHGSVPDLSRNLFTLNRNNPKNIHHNNNNNNVDVVDNSGDDDRRLSSTSTSSTITKITLNSSTTLTFGEDSSGIVSNGNSSQFSNDPTITSFESSIQSDDGYKSNSIRSLNDIQLRETFNEDRSMYCQSLGRPVRLVKPNIYTTKPSEFQQNRSQSMEAYNAEGYMTLIKTNPQKSGAYRSTSNRALSPLCTINDTNDIDPVTQMPTTSTFQRSPYHFNQNSANTELSLNNLTKFKLPRVTLNHNSTNPQQ